MPLTKKGDTVEFQVYFCTRAKKQGSNTNEVKPETCILRSLAMFFATQHLHVEDVQYLKERKYVKTKEQNIFVYHITEHNLRSQIFRKQLLNHLDANDCLIFIRKAELDFSSLFAYFLSGCTVDLKSKLKYFHEKAVHVYSGCYEDAAIDLVREVRTMQGKIIGKSALAPQTFPLIIGKTLASLSFGLPCNQIKVESVMNIPGRYAAHVVLGTVKSPSAEETSEVDLPVEGKKRGRGAVREEEWERVSLDAVPIIEKCPDPKSLEEKSQILEDDACEDDWQYHHSKMYAVYVPDRWGSNGEKLIYINFPQDTDKLPTQIVDFHSSGFSTPASLQLSEECFTPVERPLSAENYLPSSSLPCLHS
eukprot:Seg357.3 transcript_id=Seg357.3/GoldUCD/mRNA.D3Y31 product="hypothetical protein" protein_id=Seg357.3/GoldUCD/D3Y31